jgi:shikimate kinase/3-dehydroquinate synthase
MRRDKKARDGQLTFVLVRGIGQALTHREVPADAVNDLLRSEGCDA